MFNDNCWLLVQQKFIESRAEKLAKCHLKEEQVLTIAMSG
jgi:hypothetical protein